jgi:hypothetical protein
MTGRDGWPRRTLLALGAGLGAAGSQPSAGEEKGSMQSTAPERIRLVPDGYRITHAGRLRDGRLFWVDLQLASFSGVARDYVCSFIFDQDGQLSSHDIEPLGERGSYPSERAARARLDGHLAAMGDRTVADIWIHLFTVESDGLKFGLVPREVRGGEWVVDFVPGYTLMFYAPWDAGEYDT